MKIVRLLSSIIALLAAGLGVVHAGGSVPAAADGGAFVHLTITEGPHDNTGSSSTQLVSEYPYAVASPMTADQANAIIFATHNVTRSTVLQTVPFSINGYVGKWSVLNLTGHHFMGGEAFNIQVQAASDSVFIHEGNKPASNYTQLDHPLLNGNPDALISVTPRGSGSHYAHFVGVYYDQFTGRWAIFNQDMADMVKGAAFNVQVLRDPAVDFMHTASTVIEGSKTALDHPLLNGNPHANIIVTQNWGQLLNGVYNDNPIGVEYSYTAMKWRIINTNNEPMPQDAKFNVHIAGVAQHGDGVLYNGGFEATGDYHGKQASQWNDSKAGAGSKRVCNTYAPVSNKSKTVALTGECSFLLKGAAGKTHKLTQNVDLAPEQTQPLLDFRLWAKKKGAGTLKAKVKVKLDDGTTVKIGLPAAALNGKYDWKEISNARLLPPGTIAEKLTVIISLKDGGKVWLDHIESTFSMP